MDFDIKAVVDDINSKLKEGSVAPATVQSAGDIVGHVSTGIDALDAILGGGWPQGRVVEIFGHESEGKSTLLMHAFIECQRMGGVAALVDAESTFDKNRFVRAGGSLEKLLMLESLCLENAFEMIEGTVRAVRDRDKNIPLVIGVDTYAALGPASAFGDVEATSGMTIKPRVTREFLRKMTQEIARQRVVLFFLNQTIEKFGTGPGGGGDTTPGGRAIKFHSSIRLKVRRTGWIEEIPGEKYSRIGMQVAIDLIKSKVCRPQQQLLTTLLFETGFDNRYAVLDSLVGDEEEGYPVQISGSWKSINIKGKHLKFQSVSQFLKLFDKDPKLSAKFRKCWFDRLAPDWWHRARKDVKETLIKTKSGEEPCAKTDCAKCPRYVGPEQVQQGKAQCPLVQCKWLLRLPVPDGPRAYDLKAVNVKKKAKKKGKGK